MWLLDLLLLPRSTRELALLNKIHTKFNDKALTTQQTRQVILSHKWRYHIEKVELLLMFTLYGSNKD